MSKLCKKSVIFLLFWITINALSDAQGTVRGRPSTPYEKLKNITPSPEWYHTYIDSSNISTTRDGYNVLEPDGSNQLNLCNSFIQDGYLYSFHYININDIQGCYFRKTEISTGKVTWTQRYSIPDDELQEVPIKAWIINDELVIAGVRRSQPYTIYLTPLMVIDKDVRFFVRVYDKHSGTLINHTYPAKISSDGQIFSYTAGPSLSLIDIKPIPGDKFQFIQSGKINSKFYLKTSTLNQYGELIKPPDSIEVFKSHSFISKSIRPTPDIMAFIATYINDNKVEHILWTYNQQNESIAGKNLIPLIDDGERLYFDEVDGKHFIGRNTNIKTYIDGSKLMVCHLDGKITHGAEFLQPDGSNYSTFRAVFESSRDRLIVAAIRNENQISNVNTYIDLYSVDREGFSYFLNKIQISDVLRGCQVGRIMLTEEGDLLINFKERGYKYNILQNRIDLDYNAVAVSWMKFSGEDVGLMSSLPTVTNASNCLSVYPNPASDRIDVDFHAPVTGKGVVYDVLGNAHCRLGISDVSYTSIDISGWAAGVYFIQFEDKRGEKFNQTQKFIKVK
jgi:hypothetical protein